MSAVAWLVEHGAMWAVGATALLVIGCMGVALARAPAHRQRLAELTVAGTLVWMGLAVVPLPRPGAGWWMIDRGAPETSPALAPPAPAHAPPAPVHAAPAPVHAAHTPGHTAPGRDALGAPGRSGADAPARAGGAGGPLAASRETAPDPRIDGSPAPGPEGTLGPAARARAAVRAAARALAILYVGVALGALGVLLVALVRVRGVLAARVAAPRWLETLWRAEAPPPAARLLVTARAVAPFCVGARRPTVVLPHALLDEGPGVVAHVLRHELVHARRGDGRGRAVLAAALPLLAPHPLYWWLRRRARVAAELIADDGASAGDPHGYARALLALAERVVARPVLGMSALSRPSDLTRRIETLMDANRRPLATRATRGAALFQLAGALAVLVLAVLMIGTARVRAQDAARAQQEAMARAHEAVEAAQEAVALRAERDALLVELASLRALVASLQAKADAPALPAGALVGRGAKRDDALRALEALGYAGPAPVVPVMPVESVTRPASETAGDDVLGLVMQHIDLEAELELTHMLLEEQVALAERALVSQGEVRRTQRRLEQIETKLGIVRALMMAELEASEAELQELDQRAGAGIGAAGEPERARLRARLDILSRTL